MKLTQNIFMAIHILSVIAMLLLLLRYVTKSVKQVPKGLTHSGLTALVAGIVMVAIHPTLHKHYPQYGVLNMGTIALKLIFLIVILVLAYRNEKKESLPASQYWTMLLLLIINIGLASTLK